VLLQRAIKKVKRTIAREYTMPFQGTLRVRIVCYEDVNAWILGKFARKLCENLLALGVHADIASKPDPAADINHHIAYAGYDGKKCSCDTVMITHVDTVSKREQIRQQLSVARMGICMSADTVGKLATMGIPRERLCYVLPAHDGVIKPKKTLVGLTSKTHDDCRKREFFLVDLCKSVSPEYFRFAIMGGGWDSIVADIRQLGFEVTYFPQFDYETYMSLVPTFDYYLFFGFDEGSMGFLDAMAAGVPTIVTPQGYHLDVRNGIDYPFSTLDDLVHIFEQIARPQTERIEAVAELNWKNFASKHLEIWSYLLGRSSLRLLLENRGRYKDGIFSVFLNEI
jgi:hypothetical protein